MKLSKKKLIKLVKAKIENLGYKEFKDSVMGSQGLFIKKIKNDLYLSLELTISNFYDSLFTASFYLSKTTRCSSMWGDIPRISYRRLGCFLTENEKREFGFEPVNDIWWNANEDIDKFIQIINITEDRFISQNNLFELIEKSEDIKRLEKLALLTLEKVALGEEMKKSYNFQPNRNIDGIPDIFFKSAETTLIEEKEFLDKNAVKFLASDAWRISVMSDDNVSKK